jgi:hypothetical protein
MTIISLKRVSAIKGEILPVEIAFEKGADYQQIQIEIYDTGVVNPISVLGFGTNPKKTNIDIYEVNIDTNYLDLGIFEIKLVKFHTPRDPALMPQVDLISGKDFERVFFEIIREDQKPRIQTELHEVVFNIECALEQEFLKPVDIRDSKDSQFKNCCVFAFVNNLLIGTRIRFDHFEMIPTNSGLGAKDQIDFVNEFFKNNTTVKLNFPYSSELRDSSQRSNPAFVLHFPEVIGPSYDEINKYCIDKITLLLLAVALSRDASGELFGIVLLDRLSGKAMHYPIANPYIGNLLVGNLSGESPQGLETYLNGLQGKPMNQFLARLYKEARREKSTDFQYVRYWQILETLAESRNYDSSKPLLGYDGEPLKDGSQLRYIKGSVNIVFNLMRESQIGNTKDSWQKVNIWFAFRNSVAHQGSVSRYTELSQYRNKKWAKHGLDEIQRAGGHDRYLWELKEDVKLLIMRELVSSQI